MAFDATLGALTALCRLRHIGVDCRIEIVSEKDASTYARVLSEFELDPGGFAEYVRVQAELVGELAQYELIGWNPVIGKDDLDRL